MEASGARAAGTDGERRAERLVGRAACRSRPLSSGGGGDDDDDDDDDDVDDDDDDNGDDDDDGQARWRQKKYEVLGE
ncbi:hypothetical protein HOY80DRAFT_1053176 [Tuber brumale]|nr:hypothetical protein HOY80DRAFT_1053176 [Tuber brumale]